jgi:ribonucleoside-diphosphate reductase alpha chain
MDDLYGYSSKGETAFCSLSAINVDATDFDEYEEIARICVHTINILIDLAPMMTPSMKESIQRRRSIGVGITGLAGAIYKSGRDYDHPTCKQFVSEIAERHTFCLYKASIEYASKTGCQAVGVDFNWLPIDTRKGTTTLYQDWESIRGFPRANSVLVAHMPTESSAVFSNATNGLYPVRSRITEKLSRKGKVQYIAPEGDYKLAWEHDNNALAGIYGVVQDVSDQGISADYYCVPASFPDGKVPLTLLVKEWVYQAKVGNKSMYYTNTNDFTGGSFHDHVELVEEDDGCSSGACKL